MYIARRALRVAGFQGLDWATSITRVVQDAGVPASLWMGGPGTLPGSVAWSVPVGSFAEWADHTGRLMEDGAYREAAVAGRDVVVEYEPDQLIQVVHGEPTGQVEVGAYLGAIEATVHPDRTLEAMAFAVEIADAWTATTGVDALVATLAAGDMSTVLWFAAHSDAASVDAANAKIAGSSAYAEVLARGNGLYTGGVQRYARRIA